MKRLAAALTCIGIILLLGSCDLPPDSSDDYQLTSTSAQQQQDTYEPPTTRYTDSNGNCDTQDC